jgi:hypothetical protein
MRKFKIFSISNGILGICKAIRRSVYQADYFTHKVFALLVFVIIAYINTPKLLP